MSPTQALQPVVLDVDSREHGYVGPTGTVGITVTAQGIQIGVQVTVSGIDAYDAAASVLTGLYDNALHQFVAFGGGVNSKFKNWQSFGGFESYTFQLLTQGHRLPSIDRSMCLQNHFATVELYTWSHYDAIHTTWWGWQRQIYHDYYDMYLSAVVACSALP